MLSEPTNNVYDVVQLKTVNHSLYLKSHKPPLNHMSMILERVSGARCQKDFVQSSVQNPVFNIMIASNSFVRTGCVFLLAK